MLPFPKVMLCNTFQFASLEAAEISSLGVHKFGIVMSNYVLLVRYTLKFLKDYTILAKNKMAKILFSVGSKVMWESLVMKKQMQLQSQHSPYTCHCDEASCHRHVSSYNKANI